MVIQLRKTDLSLEHKLNQILSRYFILVRNPHSAMVHYSLRMKGTGLCIQLPSAHEIVPSFAADLALIIIITWLILVARCKIPKNTLSF